MSNEAKCDFRDLKCTLPAMEFSAVQWSAKRAGENHCALPLAEFMRGAMLTRVRETVRAEIARGKNIPPDIAAAIDEKRGEI
jgi:hypothetical protein